MRGLNNVMLTDDRPQRAGTKVVRGWHTGSEGCTGHYRNIPFKNRVKVNREPTGRLLCFGCSQPGWPKNYVTKGSLPNIEGKLSVRDYEMKGGQKFI